MVRWKHQMREVRVPSGSVAAPLRLSAAGKAPSSESANGQPMQARFYPYDYNGGTVLAVAGPDYSIVAGDTRMSTGFSIKSRNVSKIFQINSTTVLGTGGFGGDRTTLWKLLTAKSTQYEHQHGEGMLPHALAQSLANTLYGKRFFPYYCWNVLAGLDENGVGVVYSYDPVGNYERVRVSVTGSGESLIQPLLDNQLERQHQALGAKPPPLSTDLSLADAIDLVKDAFVSAGERDIRTGDSVELCIITKEGIRMETFPLNID